MDEATASMDLNSDKTIQDLVSSKNSVFSKSTVIIIAHRLQTIANCDLVYVLDDGKLVEKG
jgi:ABC-type multidrug transport system fused ATPase/permease subunit